MALLGLAAVVRTRVRLVTAFLTLVSLALVFGAVGGVVPRTKVPEAPFVFVALIPHLNAMLSVTGIAAILAGWWWIRQGNVADHRRAMLTALAIFATFLGLYLYRVALRGPTPFIGPDVLYTYLYLPILIVHMTLAIVCIPLLYYVVLIGLTHPVEEIPSTPHPRVGRIAALLWMTSFALGLVVYVLLYWAF